MSPDPADLLVRNDAVTMDSERRVLTERRRCHQWRLHRRVGARLSQLDPAPLRWVGMPGQTRR